MPELPEVETIVQTLRQKIGHHKITKLASYKPETVVELQPFHPFKITQITRRGKYIVITGPKDERLIIHLRMTGRLTEKPDQPRFVRAIVHTDKLTLSFEDMRRFGRIVYTINSDINCLPGINKLGPEPWDPVLNKNFYQLIHKSKKPIKTLLLDQSFLAGIGNIYADESCFHAGIAPTRIANSLTKRETKVLLHSIRYILTKAIYLRGTSFAHFIDANGKKGKNLEYLAVYGRKGLPCLKCTNPLTNKKIQGRTTVFCQFCQQ